MQYASLTSAVLNMLPQQHSTENIHLAKHIYSISNAWVTTTTTFTFHIGWVLANEYHALKPTAEL